MRVQQFALRLAAMPAVVGLVAAACAPTTAIAPTAPAATSAPAAKPAASAAPVTISFWHGMNGTDPGTQGGTLAALIQQYKAVAPNVTINTDFTSYTNNALEQKVTASIAANSSPDIVQGFE